MLVVICHPHAPRRHGHHTERVVELPERRAPATPAAPGPRALQLTGKALRPTKPASSPSDAKYMKCKKTEKKMNIRK